MKNKGQKAVIAALIAQGWTEDEALQAFRDGIAEGFDATKMQSDLSTGSGPDREVVDSHLDNGKATDGQ